MAEDIVARFASWTEPGLIHEIRRQSDGRLICSCRAFEFRRRRGDDRCKHIRAYLANPRPAVPPDQPAQLAASVTRPCARPRHAHPADDGRADLRDLGRLVAAINRGEPL